MKFEEIVAPLSVTEFARTIEASTSPVYIPGNLEKFATLFNHESLWQCVANGKPEGSDLPRVSITEYQLPIPFEFQSIKRALRSGNTVCISHIDRVSKILRNLCLDVESGIGFPGFACVHCYISPPGTGYSFFHVDSGAAVTLQIAGKKTWHYAEKPAVPWCTRVGGFREEGLLEWFGAADWQPTLSNIPLVEDQNIVETTLNPGDLLVMPPGVWHSACASETMSISLNLKLTATPSIESILQLARQTCLNDEHWRRPFPFADAKAMDSGVAPSAVLDKLRDQLWELSNILRNLAEDQQGLSNMWFRNFLGSQDNLNGSETQIELCSEHSIEIPLGISPRISVSPDGTTSLLGQGRILKINGNGVADFVREVLKQRSFMIGDSEKWPVTISLGIHNAKQILTRLLMSGFVKLVSDKDKL